MSDGTTRMTRQEVLEGLRREHARLKDAVGALGEAATTVPVTEDSPAGWTAKDILGHLIHYAGQIAFGLGADIRPPAYVVEAIGQLTPQEWNDRAVAFWRSVELSDVWREFDSTVELIVEQVQKRSDDELNADAMDTIAWAPRRPLWQFVGADTFLHEWPAHAHQIEEAAGTGP